MAEEASQTDVAPEGQEPEGGGQESQVFDAAYVKKLRDEAARYRKTAQEAAAKVTQYEQERMTELEKAQAQAKEAQTALESLRAEAQQARAQAEIVREATALGLHPELAQRLATVEFDDAGQPANVKDALTALAQQYPQLRVASAPGTAPAAMNPARKPALTVDDVKNMGTDEINARWDEVQTVMAATRR